MLVIWHQKLSKAGLHNSETSEGQIMNINLPRASKVYFISMWGFRCKIWKKYSGYLFEVKLLQTLSTIEKALAGRKKSFGGPCVVQAVCCAEALSSKDSSQKMSKDQGYARAKYCVSAAVGCFAAFSCNVLSGQVCCKLTAFEGCDMPENVLHFVK